MSTIFVCFITFFASVFLEDSDTSLSKKEYLQLVPDKKDVKKAGCCFDRLWLLGEERKNIDTLLENIKKARQNAEKLFFAGDSSFEEIALLDHKEIALIHYKKEIQKKEKCIWIEIKKVLKSRFRSFSPQMEMPFKKGSASDFLLSKLYEKKIPVVGNSFSLLPLKPSLYMLPQKKLLHFSKIVRTQKKYLAKIKQLFEEKGHALYYEKMKFDIGKSANGYIHSLEEFLDTELSLKKTGVVYSYHIDAIAAL